MDICQCGKVSLDFNIYTEWGWLGSKCMTNSTAEIFRDSFTQVMKITERIIVT